MRGASLDLKQRILERVGAPGAGVWSTYGILQVAWPFGIVGGSRISTSPSGTTGLRSVERPNPAPRSRSKRQLPRLPQSCHVSITKSHPRLWMAAAPLDR